MIMVGKREREQGKERRCFHGLKVREQGKERCYGHGHGLKLRE